MANLGFSLRSTFGLIPSTQKIETARNELINEYQQLQQYAQSEELSEYFALKEKIESEAFVTNKQTILKLDYKKTEAYTKEQRYIKLLKDKQIVNYFKVLNAADYKRYLSVNESDILKQFHELHTYLNSEVHKQIKQDLNNSLLAEKQKEKNYLTQKKSAKIKAYFKTLHSPNLKLYNELKDSEELALYEELNHFVNSDQLKELKKSVQEQLKNEIAKKKSLSGLLNRPEVKNYLKIKDKEGVEKPAALVEYETLKEYLESDSYKQKLNELQYKNTEEAKKEVQFSQLKKEAKYKTYYKFLNSKELANFLALKDSHELTEFEALETYINSEAYKNAIAGFTYSNSEDYAKEQTYNQLKNHADIKFWEKFHQSKAFVSFTQISDSELLKEFQALEEEVKSDDFIAQKNYLLDKNKWQKTEAFKLEQRFQELQNSDTIKWYFKVKDSNKFDELKAWNKTFDDDFNQGKVDDSQWMNSYFWGKMLLNDRYVLAGEKQYYTDNKNLELNGTTLKIVTKNEKARGKVWHPLHGFFEQDFDYTSGMLSSAHSFRQKYGKIEAKVKLSDSFPVYQAFWLKGEKILPEIDIFSFNKDKKNKLQLANHWGDPTKAKEAKIAKTKVSAGSLTKDFHIYTLEWSPEKISWKINNIEVFSSNQGIPDEPLYLIFSSGIAKKNTPENLPGTMEIDWVRCYEKA